MRKSRVKTMEARLAQCLAAGDATAAQAALHKCFSELDRAANAGAFHPNRASRKKGRLAARVAALR